MGENFLNYVEVYPNPDELSLCDEEIKKVFQNTNYIIGHPTQMQLAKNLRILNETLLKYMDAQGLLCNDTCGVTAGKEES